MVEEQEKDDRKFAEGTIGGEEWRDLRRRRLARLMDARLGIYGTNLREPEDIMDYFYAKILEVAGVDLENAEEKVQFPDILGEDDWDRVFNWVEQQSPEVQEYIKRNTGLKTLTPTDAQFQEDQEFLNTYYWPIRDYILDNPGKFGIPDGDARSYRILSALPGTALVEATTPSKNDPPAKVKEKSILYRLYNGIDNIINMHRRQAREQPTTTGNRIANILWKYGYNESKGLFRLLESRQSSQ